MWRIFTLEADTEKSTHMHYNFILFNFSQTDQTWSGVPPTLLPRLGGRHLLPGGLQPRGPLPDPPRQRKPRRGVQPLALHHPRQRPKHHQGRVRAGRAPAPLPVLQSARSTLPPRLHPLHPVQGRLPWLLPREVQGAETEDVVWDLFDDLGQSGDRNGASSATSACFFRIWDTSLSHFLVDDEGRCPLFTLLQLNKRGSFFRM